MHNKIPKDYKWREKEQDLSFPVVQLDFRTVKQHRLVHFSLTAFFAL